MQKKGSSQLFLFSAIVFAFLIAIIPTKALAANRPVGDIFISEFDNLRCKVLSAGTANSLGTVEIIGVEGAETYITISDTASCFDSDFNYEQFTIVSVAPNAFKGNKNIRSVTFSSTTHVTTIPKNCFANCINLTDVSLHSIKTVGNGAFRGCKRLKSLGVYDDSLKKIEKNAFLNCKKLDYFTIHDSKLKSIGKNAFKNTKKRITIYTKFKKNFTLLKKSGAKNPKFIDMTGWD